MKTRKTRRDLHKEVTERVVSMLEQGVVPWHRPWTVIGPGADYPRNGFTGRHYRGVNVLHRWAQAAWAGYASSEWYSYRNAQSAGGQVRAGEKGTVVVYSSTLRVIEEDEKTGERTLKVIPFLKHHVVFNRDQIDGLKPEVRPEPVVRSWDPVEALSALPEAIGVKVLHYGDQALYNRFGDQIRIPVMEAFPTPEAYHQTLAHETIHATGHKSRLDRDLTGTFGSFSYAREELVAELASLFLLPEFGLSPDLGNAAAYLESWIEAMKASPRYLFRAVADATRASEYLLSAAGLGEEPQEDEAEEEVAVA